jgi:hypothetical protein
MGLRVGPLAAVVLGLLLLGPSPAHAACADETLPVSSGEIERIRAAALCVMNAERAGRGVATVVRDPRLDAAAQSHGEDMARRGYYSHNSPGGDDDPNGPGGASVCGRIQRQGYDDCAGAGESLARGDQTALDVVAGLMAFDTEHCASILQGYFTEVGIGLVGGIWVFVNGAERRPYSTGGCPDKLLRDGGGKKIRIADVESEVTRTAVRIKLTCGFPGASCVVTGTLRTGDRRESRRTVTVPAGRSRTLTLRLSKASQRRLKRNGTVKARYRLLIKGFTEPYDEDVLFRASR